MRIATLVARYLLGLLFTVFGLNGFLHFLPMTPPSSAPALQFLTLLSATHYMAIVFLVQLVAGVLLLVGWYVPLAVALLAPVIVNILNFHLLLAPSGIGLGLLAAILWVLVFLSVRANFAGLFEARPVGRAVRRVPGLA